MSELYHDIITCNIPTKYELMSNSRENPYQWNDVQSFTIALEQMVDSYNEYKTSIMTNHKEIYSHLDIYFNGGESFATCIGTHGSPGRGKSFFGQ